ncbi:MAG: 1-acyl-sn-glycerol-3-phosphate acyltransferase [Bacteroidota bacterium]|nr:1-acyl-sn-glycerol-3-phosphate acyltransferase [Bacteroidota bacterium]
MLYKILFYPSRLAIHFYCRNIVINNKTLLREKGPMLIAANHPNSFLDAIIISTLFRNPVYSLARGDAFAGKFFTKILKSFNMLPVYRVSEGVENLGHNYTTFDACKKLFEENKTVLIFSEGSCTNEWKLRPLKKGTARLALSAWQNNIELKVLPLGINYSSFRFYGKNLFLNFGNIIAKKEAFTKGTDGKIINQFNEELNSQLQQLVFEIDKDDYQKLESHFYIKQPLLKKIFLFIPAIIGFTINAPFYFIIHLIIKDRAIDHYDSIMTGLLFLFYPLYVLAITLIVLFATGSSYSLLLLILIPFTAWSYLQLKRQIRK